MFDVCVVDVVGGGAGVCAGVWLWLLALVCLIVVAVIVVVIPGLVGRVGFVFGMNVVAVAVSTLCWWSEGATPPLRSLQGKGGEKMQPSAAKHLIVSTSTSIFGVSISTFCWGLVVSPPPSP